MSLGMALEEFWEASESETTAMGVAWQEDRKMEHMNRSWFVGHLIAATGMFKKTPKLQRLLDDLNSPVLRNKRTYTIASRADALEYQERFGVQLLPEGDDGKE